jgi:hypothetical protein
LHRLQDPSEINGDTLNYERYEGRRHFRKSSEYLKDKINELATKTIKKTEMLGRLDRKPQTPLYKTFAIVSLKQVFLRKAF